MKMKNSIPKPITHGYWCISQDALTETDYNILHVVDSPIIPTAYYSGIVYLDNYKRLIGVFVSGTTIHILHILTPKKLLYRTKPPTSTLYEHEQIIMSVYESIYPGFKCKHKRKLKT